MNLVKMEISKASRAKGSSYGSSCDLLPSPQNGLYDESYFHELLDLEKEKAEHAGRPFLLWLTSIDGSDDLTKPNSTWDAIVSSLSMVIRRIDTSGWYKNNSTIGVIIPNIGEAETELASIQRAVFRRMHHALADALEPDDFNKVRMTFHVLPETLKTVWPDDPTATVGVTGGESESGEDLLETPKRSSLDFEQQTIEATGYEGEKISFGSSNKCLLMLFGDVVLLVLATLCSFWVRNVPSLPEFHEYLGPCATGVVVYLAALYVFDSYNMARAFSSRDSILRIVIATVSGGLLSAASYYLVLHWQIGRIIPSLQFVFTLFMIMAWRTAYGIFFQKSMPRIRTLIVGTGVEGEFIYRLLHSHLSPYDVRGFLDADPSAPGKLVCASAVLGCIDQLPVIAEKIWAKMIILATPQNRHPRITKKILDARLHGIEVLEMATVYERLTGRVPIRYVRDEWLLFAEGFYLLSKDYVQRTKRLMDICVSGFLLLLGAPLLGLIALVVHLDSPGPVLYRQKRVGKRGQTFTIMKFRSMRQDAETNGAQWAQIKDPRVTRVGRIIRFLHLDELPQLWNIFRGDMSLIGPRPERPEFVRQLEAKIPYYVARHSVAPGVTGWAQVNYPYGASDEDAQNKLEYDLYYIKNMSLLLDLKIMLRTIGVILLGQGAR